MEKFGTIKKITQITPELCVNIDVVFMSSFVYLSVWLTGVWCLIFLWWLLTWKVPVPLLSAQLTNGRGKQ